MHGFARGVAGPARSRKDGSEGASGEIGVVRRPCRQPQGRFRGGRRCRQPQGRFGGQPTAKSMWGGGERTSPEAVLRTVPAHAPRERKTSSRTVLRTVPAHAPRERTTSSRPPTPLANERSSAPPSTNTRRGRIAPENTAAPRGARGRGCVRCRGDQPAIGPVNFTTAKIAPCGSARTAKRPTPGMSIGGTITSPPRDFALFAVASTSALAK